MRQLLAVIASAIRAALRTPLDFLEVLYEALRRKPITSAADDALAQIEQAVEQAQAVSIEPKQPSDIVVALEAEVRGVLAYAIVNARRAAAGQPPVQGPAISDERLGDWAARLDAAQAQRVLNAMRARPGALQAHLDGSARILAVPAVLSLDGYREMADADVEVALREDAEPAAKMAV